MPAFFEVLLVFIRLGLTSFGGPIAHLGYFQREFVQKRGWLLEQSYAELVALCQFLPGPTSSQVGMAIGMQRAGLAGALAAWLGFTLPSAMVMVGFALGIAGVEGLGAVGWLHGLKVAAVAVVAQALLGMSRLTPDVPRLMLAVAAAVGVLVIPSSLGQLLVIALSGVFGWRFLRVDASQTASILPIALPRWLGVSALVAFFVLLGLLPLLANLLHSPVLGMLDGFYRAGALVFGGGHVVLPLLETTIAPLHISHDAFLAGYGAAQAVPGPLFTLAAYLGAMSPLGLDPWVAASLATVAIFLPGFLLVVGVLPFWQQLRQVGGVQAALSGINAGVVGILLAALYTPVFTSAVTGSLEFALALLCFAALEYLKWPQWGVVGLAALAGILWL